jgi:hypothetical protein
VSLPSQVTPFQDRHTVGHVQPVIDQSQDWILLHGEENDFGTMLKIERAMVTCDGNDTDIVVRIFAKSLRSYKKK